MVGKDILLKSIRSSKSKIDIMTLLKIEPHYLRELSKKLDMFPSAILKHLELLENNKLVRSDTLGNKKYYKLTEEGRRLLKFI